MDQPFLQKLTEVIEANIGNPSFGVVELSSEMGMSHSNLLQKVRSYTGKSINQLIREMRLKKALEMLRSEEVTVSEVTFKVGFSSPSYFSTCFKDFFGYPPGDVKNLNPADLEDGGVATHSDEMGLGLESGRDLAEISEPKHRKSGVFLLSFLALTLVVAGLFFIPKLLRSSEPVDNSVAILPFTTQSDDPDQQFYADGMIEAIFQHLSSISELRVIRATAMDQYRNPGKTIKAIGEELNAAYTLECSFQKYKDSVWFRVRLFLAREERQIWYREFYDDWRKVFSIQSDVAQGIADEIRVAVTPMEKKFIETPPTTDITAYDYYLRGKDYQKRSYLEIDIRYAKLMYEKAIETDPGFALAWTGLSSCYRSLYWYIHERDEETLSLTKKYLDKALAISPDLKEVRLEEALYHYNCELDYQKSLLLLGKLKMEYPNDDNVHFYIGVVNRRMGEYRKTLEIIDHAITLNPSYWQYWYVKAQTLKALRQYRDAESTYLTQIGLNPSNLGAYHLLFNLYVSTGSLTKSREFLESNETFFNQEKFLLNQINLEYLDGNNEKAIELAESLPEGAFSDQDSYSTKHRELGLIYLELHDTENARIHFEIEKDFLLDKIKDSKHDERLYVSLGTACAGLGMKKEALEYAGKALEIYNFSIDPYGAYGVEKDVVRLLLMVGEYDRALNKLDLIMSKSGEDTAEILKIDPFWDPVRNHTKFIEIINNPAYQAKLTED